MTPRLLRKLAIAALLLAVGLYFIPIVTILWLAAGLIDVLRNQRRDAMLFERYFLGNGIATFILAPFNLLVDLVCYRNKGIYEIEDLPAAWRAELDSILEVFRRRKSEIIAEIDQTFASGRRGMYLYMWWGKENPH